METLYLFTDGGSRGNPGPAAIGIVLKDNQGKILEEKQATIGVATNNQAEYAALLMGLKIAQKYQPRTLICLLDSSLVVNQLNGRFKIKNQELAKRVFEIQKEIQRFRYVEFQHIPREKNARADKLLNQALG